VPAVKLKIFSQGKDFTVSLSVVNIFRTHLSRDLMEFIFIILYFKSNVKQK